MVTTEQNYLLVKTWSFPNVGVWMKDMCFYGIESAQVAVHIARQSGRGVKQESPELVKKQDLSVPHAYI